MTTTRTDTPFASDDATCTLDPTDGYCHTHGHLGCTVRPLTPAPPVRADAPVRHLWDLPIFGRMWAADGRDRHA